MLKLYFAPSSPFASKARMVLSHSGLEYEENVLEPALEPESLLKINPLGKVPVLITAHGPVFDSRMISHYLDGLCNSQLYGDDKDGRMAAQRLEALSDGMCDCLLMHVMERRARPAEKIHQPWLDRHWRKVIRALDQLNADPPSDSHRLTIGHLALRATLGYLDLRFTGEWEAGRDRLGDWTDRFDRAHPSFRQYLPHDAA